MTKPKTAASAAAVAVAAHPFATELTSGTVIDRKKMQALPSDQMAPLLAAIYMKPDTRVVIVDDTRKFFGLESLINTLDNGGADLDLMLEHNKIELTAEELAAVNQANAIKSRIKTAVEAALAAMMPPYPFATVPDDWSVETNLTLGERFVTRPNSGSHRLGYRTIEDLWNRVKPYWAGNQTNTPAALRLEVAYGTNAVFYNDRIVIGCQTIQRHELEQLALHKNWAFPEVRIKG
jgi:hypothetical protein